MVATRFEHEREIFATEGYLEISGGFDPDDPAGSRWETTEEMMAAFTPVNGLVGLGRGCAIVRLSKASMMHTTLLSAQFDTEPPLGLDQWDQVVETDIEFFDDLVAPAAWCPTAGDRIQPLTDGAGLFRLRVSVRGRDSALARPVRLRIR